MDHRQNAFKLDLHVTARPIWHNPPATNGDIQMRQQIEARLTYVTEEITRLIRESVEMVLKESG